MTMPPIRSGSTLRVASTLRPAACSIWPTTFAASSSESSTAVVSSSSRMRSCTAISRSSSLRIPATSPRRPFSVSSRRTFRTSGSASASAAARASRFTCGSICGFLSSERSSSEDSTASTNSPSSCRTTSTRPWSRAAARSASAYTRCATANPVSPLVLARDLLDVDLGDRLVDETPLVCLVEHLPGHLLRGEQGQLDDVAADLLAEPGVLRLELLAVFLEPLLQVRVCGGAGLVELDLGLAARLVEDLLPLGLGLLALPPDELAELAGLLAGLVG